MSLPATIASSIKGQTYLTGREALLRFWQVMGYEPGREIQVSINQRIYYQGFVTTDGLSLREYVCTGKDANGKKQWEASGQFWQDGYAYLLRRATQGDEIFYKANYLVGGISNEAFVSSTDIFAEDDERNEPEQWSNLAKFVSATGIQPTAVIHSGGKSLHVHNRLDSPVQAAQWLDLASQYCAWLGSDFSVTTLHRQMRLPGFPRRRKDGSWGEVALLAANDEATSTNAFKQAINESWPYLQPFDEQRWRRYKSASALIRNGKDISPLSKPADAFRLPENVLFPIQETRTYAGRRSPSLGTSENPWEKLLNDTLAPALERLPLEQVFNEYPHDFKQIGGELVGKSPWSATNTSGTSFKVSTRSGAWTCHASQQGSQSGIQYLQLLWYGKQGRSLHGREFIEFCKRLAAKVGVEIREELRQPLSISRKLSQSECDALVQSQHDQEAEREAWRQYYAEKQRQTARHTFTHVPDLLISDRYLPKVRLCDVKPGTTGLKAPCGSAKSSNVLALISRDALKQGFGVIQVGHVNSLLENTAPKLNLDTHKTVKDLASAARGIVNLSTHPNLSTTLHTLGAMIDVSRRNKPFVLILDEVEQIIQALTDRTNDTLKGTLRLAARQKLEYLVRHAEYIFLSDADLSDIVLNYFSRLRGGEKPYVIQSNFKVGEGRLPIKINPAKDSSGTIEEILECLRNGEKAIIFCDSRKDAEALIKTIEADPDLSRLNGRAVHGKVTGEPDVEKFITNIDKEYPKLDYLIYTSSLGTGVDLSHKHFTRRFLLVGGGVLAATQICQSFHRDRNDILSEIWINPATGSRECDPDKILQALKYRESGTFDMLKCAEIAVRVDAVGKVDPDDEAFLELYAQLTARKNASLNDLVASVCEELEVSGYTLELNEAVSNDDIKAEFKECKQENQQAEHEAIASSRMLSDEELATKSKSATLSLSDRYAVHKTLLHKETGLEVTPELLKLDGEGRWRKGVKHLEHLLSEPTVALLDDALDRERNPVASDRSHYAMKRNLLADLGINGFLKPGLEWRKSDPLLVRFAERCRLQAYDIKIICGFKIPKDPDKLSDVQILGEFLRRLGLATVSRQTGAGSRRERLYQIDPERMRLCQQVIQHRRKRRQEHTPSLNFLSGEASARAHPPSALPPAPTQGIETHPPLYIYPSPGGVSDSASSSCGLSLMVAAPAHLPATSTDGIAPGAGTPHQPVSPPVEPLPTPSITVGAVVTRSGSLGRWLVEAIAGQTAKVKQLGGWGFGDFPLAELEAA